MTYLKSQCDVGSKCNEVLKRMKQQYIFPLILIVLDIGASVMYGVSGDWRKVVYWLAAAILNITVTF